jgi:hypothetical protein
MVHEESGITLGGHVTMFSATTPGLGWQVQKFEKKKRELDQHLAETFLNLTTSWTDCFSGTRQLNHRSLVKIKANSRLYDAMWCARQRCCSTFGLSPREYRLEFHISVDWWFKEDPMPLSAELQITRYYAVGELNAALEGDVEFETPGAAGIVFLE